MQTLDIVYVRDREKVTLHPTRIRTFLPSSRAVVGHVNITGYIAVLWYWYMYMYMVREPCTLYHSPLIERCVECVRALWPLEALERRWHV